MVRHSDRCRITAMEKVTGIGGFFFRARDHKGLAEWYHRHLGVAPVPTGPETEPWKQEAGHTAFSPFKADSAYFGDPAKQWMLNFRVRAIDAMVAQLRAAKIEVSEPETYEGVGRFARLKDPEGNPIELWQPEG
jgi:glyoxylase I family protein